MVKFVGQDKQGNSGSQFKAPELQPQALQSSDKSFQFAQDQYNKTGDMLKGSLQFQATTAQRMSEDFSNTNATAAKTSIATMQSNAQSGDGFKQALGNLANVGQAIVQTLDNRAKNEQAQAKAVRDRNAATTWERISKWEVSAPEIARLDPAGTVKLHSQVEDILSTTEGADISSEDRQAIMKHAYGGVIAGLASKNVEDIMSQQKKVQEVNDNTATQRAIFESSSLLSTLSNSSTQEEQAVATAKLSEFLGSVAINNELKPMRKAEIMLGLTQQMNKAVFSSEENRAKSLKLMENFTAFQQDVQEARARYPDDIEQQETMIAYSMHRYSIPGGLADRFSPTKAQERSVAQQELNNKVRDLKDKSIAEQLGIGGTDNDAGYDAEMFPSEGNEVDYAASLANGNVELGKKTPAFIKYMSAKKAKKEFKAAAINYNKNIAEITLAKTQLGRQDAASNLAYLKSIKPSEQTPDLIKRLQIATGNNPAMAQFLPLIGQYDAQDAAKRAAWDQAYANATAQGFDVTRDLSAAYDQQEKAYRDEFNQKATELGRYGYRSDGTYNPDTAKMIERQRIEREAKINAAYQAQQEQGSNTLEGQPAPFRSGGGYFNGLEVFQQQGDLVMPITKTALKKQGNANVGDRVGYSEWRGRNHNGQDLGIDLRTPINAQMDGKVVEVAYQESGGGHYMRVQYADKSEHTFMHLYERPKLAVGQRIKAGQEVGLVGNTGMPGGNSNAGNSHLHWEVRRSDGSLSNPQEWSKRYIETQKNQPKQPRGGGPGSSISAPNMQVPGVPIRGGVLTPDGKGGATKISYGTSSKVLEFSQQMYDSGQQKQRKPIPPSMTFGSNVTTDVQGSFIGPNGQRFTRDANGNAKPVPRPVGYSSGGISSTANVYNRANPIRNQVNSNRASDYNINDLDNTHGFSALKKRPTLARAINEAGKSLGVPGEWLAEVMSVETGNTFDPNQKELGGSGATGLIQFFPDRDGGSTKTINGKVYNLDTIGRMTAEQQVRGPMMDYIKEAMAANGMKRIPTIQDMYALVYAYGPASKARAMRDLRGASGSDILGRLGKFSGRKYSNADSVNRNSNLASTQQYSSDRSNKLTTRIDNKVVSGCATCQLMASNGMFVPHERMNLNKGISTFNLA
jgi:murein DD-endopeptidase MepM/ murein hydrolase activator NlpD